MSKEKSLPGSLGGERPPWDERPWSMIALMLGAYLVLIIIGAVLVRVVN